MTDSTKPLEIVVGGVQIKIAINGHSSKMRVRGQVSRRPRDIDQIAKH